MKNNSQIIIFLLLVLKVVNVAGQSGTKDLPKKPEIDSTIIYGELSNGLKYFIKPLPNYKGKLNLRFYVKAGSNNEDPDQTNFAHFTEHMAFKSSDNFSNGFFNDLKLLNPLGLTLYDFNGHIGPYFSQYIFKSPQGNSEALETALRWFRDIAGGLHLKEEEIEEERGVMIQEVIQRSGDNIEDALAKDKLLSQLVPCNTFESNFIEHQKNFDPERLRQFYTDWYHPDLMAIFVVGNVGDGSKLVKKIEKNLSHISPTQNPRKPLNCDSLFLYRQDHFAVVPNKGAALNKGARNLFYFRDPLTHEKISKFEGLHRLHEMNLLTRIINKRLNEKTNTYNSFYRSQIKHFFKHPTAPSALLLTIDSKNENEKKAIQQVFQVLKRFEKYGVLKEEFEEALEQELIKFKTSNKDEPQYWLTEMEKHFVYEEFFPNNKFNLLKNWLTHYTLDDFQEFLKDIKLEMPEDIGILAPPGHPALGYTEGEIRSWIRGVKNEQLSPFIPNEIPKTILSSSEIKKLRKKNYKDQKSEVPGAREFLLKNGVKVILYSFEPSPGPNEKKVFLHGFRNQGALNFPSEDYFSAINAPNFLKNSGVKKLNKFQLQKYLSNTSLWWYGIKPYITDTETGIRIDADLEDLETMLQVVYSYFSDPRVDSTAFSDWKTQEVLGFHDNKGADIKTIDLDNNIRKVLRDNSRVLTGTERFEGLNKTDMERGFKIYCDLFSSAKDFTFLISGNFSVDSVLPLINKYLGSLSNEKETSGIPNIYDSNFLKPRGPALINFSSASAVNKSNYMYKPLFVIAGKEHISWQERLTADALGWVFNSKIIQLRFAQNYSLYTAHAYCLYNEEEKNLEIGAMISCSPEEYPSIRQEYLKMVNEFKDTPVSEELFDQSIKRMLVDYDPSGLAGTHEAVQTRLYNYYRHDVPWVELDRMISFIKELTPKDLQLAANKYFTEKNLYEFVMTN